MLADVHDASKTLQQSFSQKAVVTRTHGGRDE
jgi:hypothetical protein